MSINVRESMMKYKIDCQVSSRKKHLLVYFILKLWVSFFGIILDI